MGRDHGVVLRRPQEDVLALLSAAGTAAGPHLRYLFTLTGKRKGGARGGSGGWRQPRHMSTHLLTSPQVCAAYYKNQEVRGAIPTQRFPDDNHVNLNQLWSQAECTGLEPEGSH